MELGCPKVEHLPIIWDIMKIPGIYNMNSYRKRRILEILNRCTTLKQATFMINLVMVSKYVF